MLAQRREGREILRGSLGEAGPFLGLLFFGRCLRLRIGLGQDQPAERQMQNRQVVLVAASGPVSGPVPADAAMAVPT